MDDDQISQSQHSFQRFLLSIHRWPYYPSARFHGLKKNNFLLIQNYAWTSYHSVSPWIFKIHKERCLFDYLSMSLWILSAIRKVGGTRKIETFTIINDKIREERKQAAASSFLLSNKNTNEPFLSLLCLYYLHNILCQTKQLQRQPYLQTQN